MKITSPEQMRKLGVCFGRYLRGGEVFELIGDVGAGKTTFTKGLAAGLNIVESIQSPTFTISREYEGRDGLKLVHYDFYRIHESGILSEELDETLQASNSITVIEWADTVHRLLPLHRLILTIEPDAEDENSRNIKFKIGDEYKMLLEKVKNDFAD